MYAYPHTYHALDDVVRREDRCGVGFAEAQHTQPPAIPPSDSLIMQVIHTPGPAMPAGPGPVRNARRSGPALLSAWQQGNSPAAGDSKSPAVLIDSVSERLVQVPELGRGLAQGPHDGGHPSDPRHTLRHLAVRWTERNDKGNEDSWLGMADRV